MGSGPKWGLVRFDAATIAGQSITQATLKLFLTDLDRPGAMRAVPITSAWNQDSVTWRNQPPDRGISAPGIPMVNLSAADVGAYVSIDVTDIAREWADGSLADAGFKLVADDGIALIQFHSQETRGGKPAVLELIADAAPPPSEGVRPTVLDLSKPPVVIDAPGRYVLDRDWNLDAHMFLDPVIDAQAEGVLLDLAGSTIQYRGPGTIIRTSKDTVIRNGTLKNGIGVTVRGPGATVEYVQIGEGITGPSGGTSVDLFDPDSGFPWATIHDSRISGHVVLGGNATLERNEFSCIEALCVSAADGLKFTDNTVITFYGNPGGDGTSPIPADLVIGGVSFGGNSLVRNNLLGASNTPMFGLRATGSGSRIIGNVFGGTRAFIRDDYRYSILVDATGNLLEGNTGSVGFLQDGNVYANHRGTIYLGRTVQTDGGGNFEFPPVP